MGLFCLTLLGDSRYSGVNKGQVQSSLAHLARAKRVIQRSETWGFFTLRNTQRHRIPKEEATPPAEDILNRALESLVLVEKIINRFKELQKAGVDFKL
jgi:hypothetical protein